MKPRSNSILIAKRHVSLRGNTNKGIDMDSKSKSHFQYTNSVFKPIELIVILDDSHDLLNDSLWTLNSEERWQMTMVAYDGGGFERFM